MHGEIQLGQPPEMHLVRDFQRLVSSFFLLVHSFDCCFFQTMPAKIDCCCCFAYAVFSCSFFVSFAHGHNCVAAGTFSLFYFIAG